ncbi:UNVERIFIED_CONTAM: DNA topoisomerase domain-containing protein [Hammondia hammondi]|eukprot:XP_008882692.1 DNA topoisomerase domain-containing protein [Hammondia hammondi]
MHGAVAAHLFFLQPRFCPFVFFRMAFFPRLFADFSASLRSRGSPVLSQTQQVPARNAAFCQATPAGPLGARFSGREGNPSVLARAGATNVLTFCREPAPGSFAKNREFLCSGTRRYFPSLVSCPPTGDGASALSCMRQQPRHFTSPSESSGSSASEKANETAKPKRGPTGLQRPCDLKGPLATFMGKTEASRVEVVKHIWDYIKRHNLQSPENKRMINADSTLRPLFQKDQVSMFELNKLLSKFVQSRPSPPKP